MPTRPALLREQWSAQPMSNLEVTLGRIADALEKLSNQAVVKPQPTEGSVIELKVAQDCLPQDVYEFLEREDMGNGRYRNASEMQWHIRYILEERCRPLMEKEAAEEEVRQAKRAAADEKRSANSKKTVAA